MSWRHRSCHARIAPNVRPLSLAILAAVVIAVGVVLAVGGAWLASLGGTWYDLVAGLLLVIAGVLLWRRKPSALGVYAALLVGKTAWAVWEVDWQIWSLIPRLLSPLLLGVVLGLPWPWRRLLHTGAGRPLTLYALWTAVLATTAVGAIASLRDHAVHGQLSGRIAASPGTKRRPGRPCRARVAHLAGVRRSAASRERRHRHALRRL